MAAGWLTSPEGHLAAARATSLVARLAAIQDEEAPPAAMTAAQHTARPARAPHRSSEQTAYAPEAVAPQAVAPEAGVQVMPAQHVTAVRLAELQIRQPIHLDVQRTTPPSVEVLRQVHADFAEPDRLLCRTEPLTGSRFMKRVCQTAAQRYEDQRRLYAFERQTSLDPSGFVPGSTDADAVSDGP